MDYVSLLPPEIKKKRLEVRREGLMIRIALIVFLLFIAVYVFLLISSIMAKNNLERLQAEREMLEAQAEELKSYETLYGEMITAEEVLNSVMGTAPPWSAFLLDLGLTLPPGVTLTELVMNYGSDSGTMTMRGWTYRHSDVATMLDQLYSIEQLTDVRTRVSSETIENGSDAVQFNVDAVVLAGDQYIATDEDVVEAESPENEQEEGN